MPTDVKSALERYDCLLYSTKKNSQQTSNVNQKRFLLLNSKLPKKGNKLKKMKMFDPVSLPPCQDVLHQKMKCTNLIANRYRNAHKRCLPNWDETLHGWGSEEGKLVPVWFTGERVPENLYYDEATSVEEDSDDLQSISSYGASSAHNQSELNVV